MKITVTVATQGTPPPERSSLRVQLRDTSLADAPAVVVKEVRSLVSRTTTGTLATVQLEVDSLPRGATVWAHVDVDGDGKVSSGDYITTRSYPVTTGTTSLNVEVRRV